LILRAATAADSLCIATLHAESWRRVYREALSEAYLAGDLVADRHQMWEQRLTQPQERQRIVLAERAGELLGFACFYIAEDAQWGSYLNNLHVALSAQRQGIGRHLMHACATACEGSAHEGLYLWVLQSNTGAQAFYARHGGSNSGSDMWQAPGGGMAPLFRFHWPRVAALRVLTASAAG
jgi:ribosomal protein S18 acetylase RimI-like enzyme